MNVERPLVLSFSSPKGGVGRTMTAANVAVIYAVGCRWAAITRRPTLLIDMDLEAPGAHYYDFRQSLASASVDVMYRVRGKSFLDHKKLQEWIREESDFGLLYWLTKVTNNRQVQRVIAAHRETRAGKVTLTATLISNIRQCITEIISATPVGDPLNPLYHLVEVVNYNHDVQLYLLPPGDLNQKTYWPVLRNFSWAAFFHYDAGYAILSTLLGLLMRKSKSEDVGLGIQRILLDQNAGDTHPSVANRRFADNRILVTGLNLQNQDGLINLIGPGADNADIDDVRIVFSQYQGRQLARAGHLEPISGSLVNLLLSHELFVSEDNRRKAVIEGLRKTHGVQNDQCFLIDFIPGAVQTEFFL